VDAGWARIHSDRLNDYWVSTIGNDCGGQSQTPPNGWLNGGKIHTGPGACDGQLELPSADAGWMGFFTNPNADGKLILVIAEDKCGGGVQQVPATGVVLGKVATGPGNCDGIPEAYSYTGTAIDAGSVYIVYMPIDKTAQNSLPKGAFESLSWTGLSGWAYDNDTNVTTVHVYVDNSPWKQISANVARNDSNGNHGFSYTFTAADLASLDTSKNHTFRVYAINSPQGDNPELNGSPRTLAAQVNSTTAPTSNTVTASASITMETGSSLIFDKVKITCDTLETVNSGDTIDNVKPGQTCYLTVKVKNEGSKDLEDIEIELESDSSDVDGDSVDISSLDSGDSEEKTLELEIDEEADDGNVDMTITATGKDENGTSYKTIFNFKLEIDRLKHDLPVSRIKVDPVSVDLCKDTKVEVTVTVENKGKKDEDKVAVELSVPGLNFVKKITDIEIEQDEEEKFVFSIPVSKKTAFGSFQATAKSFFDNAGESRSKTASIVVVKCEVPVVKPEPVVVQPPKDEIIIIAPPAPEEKSSGLASGALLTGVLVLANLIALTVLGVMGYGYFRKKPDPLAEQFEDEKSLEEVSKPRDYY